MQEKYRRLREAAYARGLAEYDDLTQLPTFRDFVVLYIAEGYKRRPNTASICNSDPAIVSLAAHWLERLSGRMPIVRVQYHRDQDEDELRAFWADILGTDAFAIRLYPKSNRGQLRTRIWRCEHGVASVDVHDTYLRARIQAWIDRIRAEWSLDSAASSGA